MQVEMIITEYEDFIEYWYDWDKKCFRLKIDGVEVSIEEYNAGEES